MRNTFDRTTDARKGGALPRRVLNGVLYVIALALAFARAWIPGSDPLVYFMHARGIPLDSSRPLYLAAMQLDPELIAYLIGCGIVWWLAAAKNSPWRYGALVLGAAAVFVQAFGVFAYLPRGITPLKELWLSVSFVTWLPVLPALLTYVIVIVATRPAVALTPADG